MIEAIRLPDDFVTGTAKTGEPWVKKLTLEGIDEIQCLHVAPQTSIKLHGHDNQWEVWASLADKTAYVCLIGEEHKLVNNSSTMMVIMAIKGHLDYSYDDLTSVFRGLGFSVKHGSLLVNVPLSFIFSIYFMNKKKLLHKISVIHFVHLFKLNLVSVKILDFFYTITKSIESLRFQCPFLVEVSSRHFVLFSLIFQPLQ